MAIVSKTMPHRCHQTLTVAETMPHRHSNNKIWKTMPHRCHQTLTVAETMPHRHATFDGETLTLLKQPGGTKDAGGGTIETYPSKFEFGVQVKITDISSGNSITLPNVIEDIQYSEEINCPATWSINIPYDMDRDFSLENTSSPYYDYLQPDAFSSPTAVKKIWQISCKIGGDTWTSPNLILVPATNKNSATGGYSATFEGTDMSRLLMIENKTLATQKSTNSSRIAATDILEAILTSVGIDNWDLSRMDDYYIRKMHLQAGSPMDWISRILNVPQAIWRFEGNQFIAEQPVFEGKSNTWVFQDRVNINSLDYTISTADLENQVEIVRTQEVPSVEEHEGNDTFVCTITLQYPRWGPRLRVFPCDYGSIENIEWINEAGQYQSEGGLPPYTQCQFFFQPDYYSYISLQNATGGTCHWRVQVSGVTQEQQQAGLSFDDSFSVIVRDMTSQGKYGLLSAPNPIEDPLIPDSTWAQTHGTRYLAWKKLGVKQVTFVIPYLFPWLVPNQNILITNYGTNHTEQRFYVLARQLNFKSNQTTIKCAIYE